MTKNIIIIDYGVGNLYSVQRAVEKVSNLNICISNKKEDLENADKIILPGVGAFEDGINGLHVSGLVDTLKAASHSGKPILGICLGMQLLATLSQEFGEHKGLNLIPGIVMTIPNIAIDDQRMKIPFVGWASLQVENQQSTNSFAKSLNSQSMYFVHSYQVIPDDPNDLLATYSYGGHKITAAIKRKNITGVQFHPEKSGEVGLKLLELFLKS